MDELTPLHHVEGTPNETDYLTVVHAESVVVFIRHIDGDFRAERILIRGSRRMFAL
jgi:hypothetical protein